MREPCRACFGNKFSGPATAAETELGAEVPYATMQEWVTVYRMGAKVEAVSSGKMLEDYAPLLHGLLWKEALKQGSRSVERSSPR